jgi:hypothetical protein
MTQQDPKTAYKSARDLIAQGRALMTALREAIDFEGEEWHTRLLKLSEMRQLFDGYTAALDSLAASQQRVAELEAAISGLKNHSAHCAWPKSEMPCDCGYSNAMAVLIEPYWEVPKAPAPTTQPTSKEVG